MAWLGTESKGRVGHGLKHVCESGIKNKTDRLGCSLPGLLPSVN